MFDKDDYFLSGAVQTAPVYYETAFRGAVRATEGDGMVINENGFGTFYMDKVGVTAVKDAWLALSLPQLEEEYARWLKKWSVYDDILYEIATTSALDWRVAWEKLDKISTEFWRESYRLDATDPFAEELEAAVKRGLQQATITEDLMHEMISPAATTLPQQIEASLHDVKTGRFAANDFLRRYWFKRGTWNGGGVLQPADLDQELTNVKPSDELASAIATRQKLHADNDQRLDSATRQLVTLLRTLILWREQRKGFLQQTSIGFDKVTSIAAEAMHVDPLAVKWAKHRELPDVQRDSRPYLDRSRLSVFLYSNKDLESRVAVGQKAAAIAKIFKAESTVTSLNGTVASPGKIVGRVRVILRQGEFHRFQEGEILVTAMTRPEFVPLMRRAAAIITDEGGLTSHAAIVSRELKKPCVIGTKIATQVLKDGDEIEVDAHHGKITIIKNNNA